MKISVLMLLTLFISSCFFESSSPEKKELRGPREWQEWLNQKKSSFKKEFSVPTVTHNTYFESKGSSVWVSLSGAYPRFLAKKCSDCLVKVQRVQKQLVFISSSGDSVPIKEGEPVALSEHPGVYIKYDSKPAGEKIRAFLYDLNLKRVKKKRERVFFEYKEAFKQEGLWSELKASEEVIFQRSDGSQKKVRKIAEIKAEKLQPPWSLSVYDFGVKDFQKKSVIMVLFRDKTSGVQTYGAGRFLNINLLKSVGEQKDEDVVPVDFNYSYNPPCAASTGFHCPLPQDFIPSQINVGEKYLKH